MPPYIYALSSALLWAASVPILNIGIRRLPEQSLTAVIPGLLVSMTMGTFALGLFVFPISNFEAASGATIAAGLFTYPIATGLYYMASYAFGARTEFAAQFSKVKPLFSLIIALFFLGETITSHQTVSATMVVVGILLFLLGVSRHSFTINAVILGLLTALAWAIGEAFVKIGFVEGKSIEHSFFALASGTLFAWFLYPLLRIRIIKPVTLHLYWLWPFAAHGLISFGIAYTLFFHSITKLGLYPTVLINAFWPFLSIVLARLIFHPTSKHVTQRIPIAIWLASSLLLVASLIEIIMIHSQFNQLPQ